MTLNSRVDMHRYRANAHKAMHCRSRLQGQQGLPGRWQGPTPPPPLGPPCTCTGTAAPWHDTSRKQAGTLCLLSRQPCLGSIEKVTLGMIATDCAMMVLVKLLITMSLYNIVVGLSAAACGTSVKHQRRQCNQCVLTRRDRSSIQQNWHVELLWICMSKESWQPAESVLYVGWQAVSTQRQPSCKFRRQTKSTSLREVLHLP